MTDATELDLDAVRARLDAATEGPWRFSNTTDTRGRKGEFRAPSPHNGFMLVGPWTNDADAEFIAHARTDVERLLAALDEARAEVERREGMFRRCLESENRAQADLAVAESSLAAVLAGIEELAAANDVRMGRSGASAYTGIGSDALRALASTTERDGQ